MPATRTNQGPQADAVTGAQGEVTKDRWVGEER